MESGNGSRRSADVGSILVFVFGAALLVYSAEKLIVYLVGAASGLRISVFLLAIIFTGIEFDDLAYGVVLNREDLSNVALGTVFGTAIAMTGIVLALAAIITPTRVNIPRDYIIIFALTPLVLIPFALTARLTAVHGAVLLGLFVLFIAYVAYRELRASTPVFRNAEILERVGVGGGPGEPPARTGGGPTGGRPERPTDQPPFRVSVPFARHRSLPGWAALLLAMVALVGLVAGAIITGIGTDGILNEYDIDGTVFGATIATVVLSIEDIFLTVEPARKGAAEIGVGNVIGSVVFGVTGKLGIILLAGGSIAINGDVTHWHLPVLIVMTALGAVFIATGRLRRWQGILLLTLYVAYWVISFTVFGGAPIEND
jgi:cation:H+ antiporter